MKRILTLTLAIALAAGATQARVTPSFAADSPPSLVAMPGGPISGRLSSGAAFVYQRTSGAPIAVVELWYRAPATGFGPAPIPSLSRLAAEAVLSSKPLTAKPLGSTLSDMGGRINVSAYADSIVIAATVPSASAKSVVQALTRSFFAPVLTDDGFKEARREVQMETLLDQYDPEAQAHNAVFSHLFTTGPLHVAPLGTPEQLTAVTVDQVRGFAKRAFRAQNAVLVVGGTVDRNVVEAAAQGRPPESPSEGQPEPFVGSQLAPAPQSGGNISFPGDPVATRGWVGPAITDEREATALDFIADYLFRPQTGTVSRVMEQTAPDAYLVGQFITLQDPGVFMVTYSGKDLDAVRAAIDKGIDGMRKPLDHAKFVAALSSFQYHMLSDLQTPQQLVENFGWYSIQGNFPYAPLASQDGDRSYVHVAASLTPEFVAQVVQKYLNDGGVRLTLKPTEKPKS